MFLKDIKKRKMSDQLLIFLGGVIIAGGTFLAGFGSYRQGIKTEKDQQEAAKGMQNLTNVSTDNNQLLKDQVEANKELAKELEQARSRIEDLRRENITLNRQVTANMDRIDFENKGGDSYCYISHYFKARHLAILQLTLEGKTELKNVEIKVVDKGKYGHIIDSLKQEGKVPTVNQPEYIIANQCTYTISRPILRPNYPSELVEIPVDYRYPVDLDIIIILQNGTIHQSLKIVHIQSIAMSLRSIVTRDGVVLKDIDIDPIPKENKSE